MKTSVKYFHLTVGAQGQVKVGQGGLKVFHLWRHSQKTHIPQAKNFFSSADKTCCFFWHFDQVCSTYRTGEILAQSHVRFGVFFWKSPKAAGRQSVTFEILFDHLLQHDSNARQECSRLGRNT